MTDAQYTEILKKRLTEKRFIHSLNVADSAKELARNYGFDENIAYTAGLIHDVCKDTTLNTQLAYMLEKKSQLTDLEINTPKLYHAMCGALFIKYEFGIENQDIINAVRYHTTGRKGMSLLEKIVFIADFISAERDYDGVEIMREKAKRSLDGAIVEGLSFTIKDLIDNGRVVHPDTLDAYNDAVFNMMKQEKNNES